MLYLTKTTLHVRAYANSVNQARKHLSLMVLFLAALNNIHKLQVLAIHVVMLTAFVGSLNLEEFSCRPLSKTSLTVTGVRCVMNVIIRL